MLSERKLWEILLATSPEGMVQLITSEGCA